MYFIDKRSICRKKGGLLFKRLRMQEKRWTIIQAFTVFYVIIFKIKINYETKKIRSYWMLIYCRAYSLDQLVLMENSSLNEFE